MTWPQAWTRRARNVDRHIAVLLGGLFANAHGWDFGQEVELANVLMLTPRAGTPGLVTPEAGNPLLETV